MNEEPLEAKEVQHWTLDQLFAYSLEEMRKRFGPKVVEADKPRGDELSPRTDMKLIEDASKDAS